MQLEFLLKLQEIGNTYLDYFFIMATNLGNELIYTIAIAIIFWCISKNHGIRLFIAVIVTSLVNADIKELFKIERPLHNVAIQSIYSESAPGYSFPSGHTQAATSFWFYSSMMLRKKWFSILSIIIVCLVGFSRLYLRVHWPIDVIGGAVIGVIVVFAVQMIARRFNKHNYSNFTVIASSILLPMILIVLAQYDPLTIKLGAVFTGGLLGYFTELKYINFNECGSIGEQILKVILGITGVIAIKIVFKMSLPELLVSDAIRYLIMGLWITFFAPWIFVKTKLSSKKI